MVNNEEEPNIFMFGDKEDWKNFLLEITHFLNKKIHSIEQ
jgi:hypothetical protein